MIFDQAALANIKTGRDLASDVVEAPDVCIVGSGAGGSVLAFRLAQMGKRVVVLEDGGFYTARDFTMQEATAFPHLYQEHGNRATADMSITILQGRALGGSTVVNWTTCFRTPGDVLQHWADRHGVKGLTPQALDPHWSAIEERLGIEQQPADEVNPNNAVLRDGGAKLGIKTDLIRRNVRGCMNSGYCGMGCPVNAKQSMLITFIPDAARLGAKFYANARAVKIDFEGRRAAAVHAVVSDPDTDRPNGRAITVKPKLLVLSGGAINTPALLLRSGMNPNGRVGKRTFLHPVIAGGAVFAEPVEGFYGAPQSISSHHFARRAGKVGFFLETAPIHPMLASIAGGGMGKDHQAMMAQLGHLNSLIALSIDGFLPEDDEGGEVTIRGDGRIRVDYEIRPPIWEALREGAKAMARIQLAAGAKQAFSFHSDPVLMQSEGEVAKLDRAPWEKLRVAVFTAHQMGGCAMGGDPETSVVDSTLKHHHLDNLFVVDGSAFPTSLGVNPQLSVYGLSHWAAGHVAAAV